MLARGRVTPSTRREHWRAHAGLRLLRQSAPRVDDHAPRLGVVDGSAGWGRAWREEDCRAPGREPSLGARRETSSSPTRLCLVRSASLRLAAPSSGRPGAICVAPGRAQRIGSGREPPHSP